MGRILMQLALVAIGTGMPGWIQTGFRDYYKRFPTELRLQLIEITASKRTKNTNISRALQEEGERMLAAIPKNSRIIALEIEGDSWDTPTLAIHLKQWQIDSRPVSFLIGGADGLAAECIAKAEQKWSLSALTFPHPLVRIIVAEQLYRAWTLLKGHPYHRG